jgi:hypothetical protein
MISGRIYLATCAGEEKITAFSDPVPILPEAKYPRNVIG